MRSLVIQGIAGVAALVFTAAPCRGERPTVGLALGGGGALGMSHIGVLRVLEEENIPVDYIAGTSMGAIIGGLYASGMSPDEIQAFLQGLDWEDVMSDKTARRELYFRRKFEDQRYLLELGVGKGGIKYGTGMAAGQKFNNLLQWQVQRSASITDFDDLPIPYRAVATDLMTGTPYVISHGNLAKAMRASMAVPGAFTAVEIDGHLLVDGGIVDNLPVDVVKSMGADIIIAVDVGSKSDRVTREDLDSIAGVLARTYAIMHRPEQLESLSEADIGIQPRLDDFTAAQFDRVAEIVPPGEAAARQHLDALRRLSVDEQTYAAYTESRRRPEPSDIRIETVEVAGNHRVSETLIRGRIHSRPGDMLEPRALDYDLLRIYGIGEFEQVLYQFDQNDDQSGALAYNVTEKSWGPTYLFLSYQLESNFEDDSTWGILLNLTRRSINSLGAEWRNEIELGSTRSAMTEFYQPVSRGGLLFVSPWLMYRDEDQDVYQGKDHIADYDVELMMAEFDLGLQWKNIGIARVGPAVQHYRGDTAVGPAGLPSFDDDLVVLSGTFMIDQKDRAYFTRNGYAFAVHGIMTRSEWGSDESFDKISAEGSLYHSLDRHTFSARLQYGTSLDSTPPAYELFALGGLDSFAGLAQYQFRGTDLAVGSLGYACRFMQLPSQAGNGIYALTRYDVGNVWQGASDYDDLRHGIALGLGMDTVLGPCYLVYGWASGGYDSVYLSLGSKF